MTVTWIPLSTFSGHSLRDQEQDGLQTLVHHMIRILTTISSTVEEGMNYLDPTVAGGRRNKLMLTENLHEVRTSS